MTWVLTTRKSVEYDKPIEAKAYFDRLIEIWSEHPHSITRRVSTCVPIDVESDVACQVLEIVRRKNDMAELSDIKIRKLIRASSAREYSENSYEVYYYEEDLKVRFYPVVLDNCEHPLFCSPYAIGCRIVSETVLSMDLFKPHDAPEDHFTFFKSQVILNIADWIRNLDISKSSIKTMDLIDKENYFKTYRAIRNENSKYMIENWTERSNPEKSVFEDCGITAYILELFHMKVLPKSKKFVDLGCGNGLLVHLLQKNGIAGYGIDVRARKIWSTMLKDSDLRIGAVNPQEVVNNKPHLDEDVDLLIGNHSDELTPWIPIMAAKLNCNFFIIPCCPFHFFGKYNNTGSYVGPKRFVSQYASYFEWIITVSKKLGFEVFTDRLAIPSTKRTCIIGRVPQDGLDKDLNKIINDMTAGNTFIARSSKIVNRNCTNISISDRERISKLMFQYILNKSDQSAEGWRSGGVVQLSELAGLLSEDDRKLMKDQCGGLQTFLRNNFQIFEVHGGEARLRDLRKPRPVKSSANKNGKKPVIAKSCWMSANHPDGCPVGKEKCQFTH